MSAWEALLSVILNRVNTSVGTFVVRENSLEGNNLCSFVEDILAEDRSMIVTIWGLYPCAGSHSVLLH